MKLSQLIVEMLAKLLEILCQQILLWLWVLVIKFGYVVLGAVCGI